MRIPSSSCLLALAATLTAQGPIQVVAATGDPVPTIPGATVANVQMAAIGLDGRMLWRSDLAHDNNLGIDGANDRVMCFGRSAADQAIVARTGQAEPSGTMPSVVLGPRLSPDYLLSPVQNVVMFGAELSGPGIVTTSGGGQFANDQALYWGPPGALQVLVRRGDPLPGRPGQFVDDYFSFMSSNWYCIGPNGTTAVSCQTNDAAMHGSFCMLIGTPGNLTTVVMNGDPVPIGSDVPVIEAFGLPTQMNGAGKAPFIISLSHTAGTPPAPFGRDELVAMYTPGVGIEVIALEGGPAPGTPGCAFSSFMLPDTGFAENGNFAFHATLLGGDAVPGVNDEAFYRLDGQGHTRLLFRSGALLPDGSAVDWFTRVCSLANDDELLVCAHLIGPSVTPDNEYAILRVGQAGHQVVLRTGSSNPALPALTVVTVNYAVQRSQLGQIFLTCGNTDANNNYVHTALLLDPLRGTSVLMSSGDVLNTGTGPQTAGAHYSAENMNGEGSSLGTNSHGDHTRMVYLQNGRALVRIPTGALHASTDAVPATGGRQDLTFQGSPALAGSWYLVLGSLSGSRPSTHFGGLSIPLAQDFWTPLSQQHANSAAYPNSLGQLDATGASSAAFVFPPNATFLQGVTFTHVQVVVDLATGRLVGSTQPVDLRIL